MTPELTDVEVDAAIVKAYAAALGDNQYLHGDKLWRVIYRAGRAEAIADAARWRDRLHKRNECVIDLCATLDAAGERWGFDPSKPENAEAYNYFHTVSMNLGCARVVCTDDNAAIDRALAA